MLNASVYSQVAMSAIDSFEQLDQLPRPGKQLALAQDSIIVTKQRGLKQLAKLASISMECPREDVPAPQDKLSEEQAKNARTLHLLRVVLTAEAEVPKPSRDDDWSEPDLEKVDSVVIIQLRTPVSRAKSAPPIRLTWPSAVPAAAAAAPPPAAVALALPAAAGPVAVAEAAPGPQAMTAQVTSSSSGSAAASLTSPGNHDTEIATLAASNSSTGVNVKKALPGKKVLKSASKKLKAAAASIAQDFREGFQETTYAIASSSAMLALWPVPLPASAYTGLYSSHYNPYNPYNCTREYH
jgi:hypothetical protein